MQLRLSDLAQSGGGLKRKYGGAVKVAWASGEESTISQVWREKKGSSSFTVITNRGRGLFDGDEPIVIIMIYD